MQPDNRTWDPGSVQEYQENKLFKIYVSDSTYFKLRTAIVSVLDVSEENDMEESSRTELDSHANMPVVGRNAYIISDTGRVADVNPFTPDYDSMTIPIVDAAVGSISMPILWIGLYPGDTKRPTCSVDAE